MTTENEVQCIECKDERRLAQAVFELAIWRRGGTSFLSQLYELLAKADATNTYKLSLGFPAETEAFLRWKRSRTEQEFFSRYKILF